MLLSHGRDVDERRALRRERDLTLQTGRGGRSRRVGSLAESALSPFDVSGAGAAAAAAAGTVTWPWNDVSQTFAGIVFATLCSM